MARVVAVHGILNTYSGERSMAASWVPALLDGIGLAGGDGTVAEDDIGCVFYGDVFRHPGRLLGATEAELLDADDIDDPADAALLDAWWAEAARTDRSVPPTDERMLGLLKGAQAALAALACSRFLAGATERLLILWLKQVRQYFTDSDRRAAIQDRFARQIRADTEVVVAHSLGSVVAYEALCAHPEWNVRGLVTLGSPLAVRNLILDRLTPAPEREGDSWRCRWPGGVKSWTNIADRADFVALVKVLGNVFGAEVTDVEIDNGVQVHAVTRYLTARSTGEAILAALRG
ncbi:hypothetical protein GCM10010169_64150 [Micromonospora fulviviridis]|uniref:alpha/beta hydrolase n=1 Tax=Micromonospora fulviviridis TaxID=47860 RepID=UPI001668CE2E|nr:alpha/beta hydrolase [Micromonospora fulviviridis]GGS10671.1 hypothetical protein GCM10010169_64150 [Micromonospora fulviviridis]